MCRYLALAGITPDGVPGRIISDGIRDIVPCRDVRGLVRMSLAQVAIDVGIFYTFCNFELLTRLMVYKFIKNKIVVNFGTFLAYNFSLATSVRLTADSSGVFK